MQRWFITAMCQSVIMSRYFMVHLYSHCWASVDIIQSFAIKLEKYKLWLINDIWTHLYHETKDKEVKFNIPLNSVMPRERHTPLSITTHSSSLETGCTGITKLHLGSECPHDHLSPCISLRYHCIAGFRTIPQNSS